MSLTLPLRRAPSLTKLSLQVLGRRRGHDHRPAGTFAGGSGGRGDAAPLLDESRGDVRGVVHQVEDRVEAVGVALAGGRGEVAVAGQQLADAELAQVGLVLGQRRGDDGGAGTGGELDGEAADAAGRAPTISTVSPLDTSRASIAVIAVMPASGAAPTVAVSTPVRAGAIEVSCGTAINSAQLPS
jgi:hypothetical protein